MAKAKAAKKKTRIVRSTSTFGAVPPAGPPGSMLYSDGFNWVQLAPGDVGKVLTMGVGNVPFWGAN